MTPVSRSETGHILLEGLIETLRRELRVRGNIPVIVVLEDFNISADVQDAPRIVYARPGDLFGTISTAPKDGYTEEILSLT